MVVGTSRSATGRASKRPLASATRSIAGGSKGCSEDGCRRAFKRRRLRKKKIRQLFSTAQTRGGAGSLCFFLVRGRVRAILAFFCSLTLRTEAHHVPGRDQYPGRRRSGGSNGYDEAMARPPAVRAGDVPLQPSRPAGFCFGSSSRLRRKRSHSRKPSTGNSHERVGPTGAARGHVFADGSD